jgi:phage shock protein A
MRLFRRVSDIISANLNDLVDRFEEPETMLKQAIREMEATIADTTAATAKAIAGERLLAKELAEHEAQIDRWRTRAERLVREGDDALARRALVRLREHDTLARALRDQVANAREAGQSLRRQVEAMKAKHVEARRKLASLTARKTAADAYRSLQTVPVTGHAARPNGFDRYERLRDNIDLAVTAAGVYSELLQGVGEEWVCDLESRERDESIDLELAAIKEKFPKGSMS